MALFDILSAALRETDGLEEAAAQRKARAILDWGAENGHGGIAHYWPLRARCMSREERDAAIAAEFNGTNLRAVCERYEVSHTTVYRAARRY